MTKDEKGQSLGFARAKREQNKKLREEFGLKKKKSESSEGEIQTEQSDVQTPEAAQKTQKSNST